MMTNLCAAYGCSNKSGSATVKEKGISFHQFPLHDKIRLKIWIVNMKRKNFKPTRTSRMCSEHFVEADFEYQLFTNKRFLKNTAVPTKFCFTENGAGDKPQVIYKYYEKRIAELDICKTVETPLRADKSTQTVDEFTSYLLAEVKKLKAENVALRGALQKFDMFLDVLT